MINLTMNKYVNEKVQVFILSIYTYVSVYIVSVWENATVSKNCDSNLYTPKIANASTWRVERNQAVSFHADSGLPFSAPLVSHRYSLFDAARLKVGPFAALPVSRALASNVDFEFDIATTLIAHLTLS